LSKALSYEGESGAEILHGVAMFVVLEGIMLGLFDFDHFANAR